MTTYKNYKIVPATISWEGKYEVQAENHDNGRIHYVREAGGYPTIKAAKEAINCHFDRL